MIKSFITLVPLLFSAYAYATDSTATTNAPREYTRHCVACHARMTGGEGETLYRRDDRMARDKVALRARVNYCQNALELRWSPAQITAVVDYLNRRFYHFPDTEK